MTTDPGSSPENSPAWPHSNQPPPPPQYPAQPQQPQYQQPQYEQPQYEQPQYQAPQYPQPQYEQPQYPPPQYQAPQYPAQPQYPPPQQAFPSQGPQGWEAQQPAQPGWEQPPPIWGAPQGVPAGEEAPVKRRIPVIGKVAIGVGVLTIMACLCGIGAVFLVPSLRSNNASSNPSAFPSASHPSGISATSTAGASGSGGPFAGTPAAAYPAGAAGITLPKAVKTGVFSAADVSKALTSVQKALIAARLDKQMVVNRNTDPFLKLMAADARADLRKDFSSDTFATYATQIATGSKLAPQTPRVKGRITYRATKASDGIRVIEVITNFVWVYPFVAPSQAPGDDIVVVHDEVTWQVPDVNDVASTGRGLWIDHAQSYGSNIDCTQINKGYLAPGTTQAGSGPTEDPNAMYDPEHTIDIKNSC